MVTSLPVSSGDSKERGASVAEGLPNKENV